MRISISNSINLWPAHILISLIKFPISPYFNALFCMCTAPRLNFTMWRPPQLFPIHSSELVSFVIKKTYHVLYNGEQQQGTMSTVVADDVEWMNTKKNFPIIEYRVENVTFEYVNIFINIIMIAAISLEARVSGLASEREARRDR